MKINCKPRRREREKRHQSVIESYLWAKTLPFNVNPRGVLIHRVRIGKTHFLHGSRSHDSCTYWCNNGTTSGGMNLTDNPPADRLLCVHCETRAVAAGEPTAAELAGRHVCIGEMKAHRLCCRNEDN